EPSNDPVQPSGEGEGKNPSAEQNDPVEPNNDHVEPVEPVVDPEPNEKVFHKFALAHDDIRNILWEQVNDYVEAKQLGERWDFWIQKVYDDHFILQDEYKGTLYKVEYSKENDTIT